MEAVPLRICVTNLKHRYHGVKFRIERLLKFEFLIIINTVCNYYYRLLGCFFFFWWSDIEIICQPPLLNRHYHLIALIYFITRDIKHYSRIQYFKYDKARHFSTRHSISSGYVYFFLIFLLTHINEESELSEINT